MQNRAFLPTRLRNKKCCLSVGWGILRRKLMKAKISEAEELQLPMFYLDDNKNIVKNLYHIVDKNTGQKKY